MLNVYATLIQHKKDAATKYFWTVSGSQKAIKLFRIYVSLIFVEYRFLIGQTDTLQISRKFYFKEGENECIRVSMYTNKWS